MICAIVGLIVIGGLFDEAVDRLPPLVAYVLGIFVLSGSLFVLAYMAGSLTIHSYSQRVYKYDINHPDETRYGAQHQPETVERAHGRIAERVAVKFALVAVAIFWLLYFIRSCSE